jgi:hypothetical protein
VEHDLAKLAAIDGTIGSQNVLSKRLDNTLEGPGTLAQRLMRNDIRIDDAGAQFRENVRDLAFAGGDVARETNV